MMTFDKLTEKWKSLTVKSGESVHQGYDANHPMQFFIGLDVTGKHEFFLITNNQIPELPAQSKSIEVLEGQRKDGSHTLVFRLAQQDQQQVFIHLCWDLAESSRHCSNTKQGLVTVLARYAQWQRLMEKGRNRILTESELKGIFGEICFMLNNLVKKYGISKAIQGWVGPLKLNRDFVYEDLWYEVKTTNPGAAVLRISSVEQLDTDDDGYLVWIQAEKTSISDPQGTSVPRIVSKTRDLLKTYPSALERFEMLLIELGYIDCKEYESILFTFKNIKQYCVSKNFPRIRRADINTGIVSVAYDLSVAYITGYEILQEG